MNGRLQAIQHASYIDCRLDRRQCRLCSASSPLVVTCLNGQEAVDPSSPPMQCTSVAHAAFVVFLVKTLLLNQYLLSDWITFQNLTILRYNFAIFAFGQLKILSLSFRCGSLRTIEDTESLKFVFFCHSTGITAISNFATPRYKQRKITAVAHRFYYVRLPKHTKLLNLQDYSNFRDSHY